MASFALVKLANRKLLKVSGPDCYPYLQGLLSNDLRYLYEPDRIPKRKHAKASPNVLAAFMLNPMGRVLCDMILYRTPQTKYNCQFTPPGQATDPDELLIECDSSIASGVANTLYGYRVRRKISLELQENKHIWCLYPNLVDKSKNDTIKRLGDNHLDKFHEIASKDVLNNDITIVSDPRLEALGARILSYIDNFDELKKSLQSQFDINIQPANIKNYTVYRHHLGVGEGIKDHPEGNCLPLECNGDLLGAICFNKGCYLGQELTARIHFTGVLRRRLMPIVLDVSTTKSEPGSIPLIEGSDIINQANKKKVGVLRSVVKGTALALLRKDLIDDSTKLIHEGSKTEVTTWKPFWWQ